MNIKANDTAITFLDTLTLDDVPVDLTGSDVLFILAGPAASDIFSDDAVVASGTGGEVSYMPGVDFPTTPGTYRQEWEVTFPNATKLSFPGDRNNTVVIMADLNRE